VWKSKVRAARAARPAQEEDRWAGFWDEKRSAWFNRFAGKSDRSHTYRFIEPYVKGQVLEIGPGPGAYTRLLVEKAERVVAVEPSPFMVQCLRENLAGCSKLEIVVSTIEDYLDRLESYDLALAANVLGGIERIDEVLSAVTRHAKVLAIVMWSNAVTPEWSKAVQREVLGRAKPDPDMPSNDDLLAVLDELGLAYEAHRADVPIHTFGQRDEVVDWVLGFFSLPEDRRSNLERVLAPFISESEDKYGLPSGRETQVVLVRGGQRSRLCAQPFAAKSISA